ncbi:hypothetical protein PGQ11_001788 [Apiospora arundinis]|uniref:Secreted protein n=1 Tax=Apiospora arundinis TaxID=335852 RepID=A0ABR2JGS8_9PEZI
MTWSSLLSVWSKTFRRKRADLSLLIFSSNGIYGSMRCATRNEILRRCIRPPSTMWLTSSMPLTRKFLGGGYLCTARKQFTTRAIPTTAVAVNRNGSRNSEVQ